MLMWPPVPVSLCLQSPRFPSTAASPPLTPSPSPRCSHFVTSPTQPHRNEAATVHQAGQDELRVPRTHANLTASRHQLGGARLGVRKKAHGIGVSAHQNSSSLAVLTRIMPRVIRINHAVDLPDAEIYCRLVRGRRR